MSGQVNWKLKYQELKSKYMNSVDVAFRLGVEEGLKQASVDTASQQMAQGAQGVEDIHDQPGTPGAKANNNDAVGVPDQGSVPDKSGAPSIQPDPVEGAAPMKESENPNGSELDQHIAKLEGMLSKSEELDLDTLKKTVEEIKGLQQKQKEYAELKKSSMAIPKIAHAMHKPQFKFGVQAQHNLNSTAKAAVSMQHKIVNELMQKWETEEKKASKDILSILKLDGTIKE